MEIKGSAMAGTLESSDASIVVAPNADKGIVIDLISSVEKQFGEDIRRTVKQVLKELDVEDAIVKIQDRGALDCVIRARLQTAVLRAANGKSFDWEGQRHV